MEQELQDIQKLYRMFFRTTLISVDDIKGKFGSDFIDSTLDDLVAVGAFVKEDNNGFIMYRLGEYSLLIVEEYIRESSGSVFSFLVLMETHKNLRINNENMKRVLLKRNKDACE